MKLFTVKMSFEFVVVADDEKQAKAAALANADEALKASDYEDIAVEIRPGADARGWEDPICIPVNSMEDKSIRDYLEEDA
jgi:hypothetical protein